MKLLIYTANLGSFDKTQNNEEQELPEGIDQIDYWRCTDVDFPPRFNAMTPRLQARIVKMFGWQMRPGYDLYLWVDSSCRLPRVDCIKEYMIRLGDAEILVFKHNKRRTIKEEADYLRRRLIDEKEGRKQPYVLPRYENEDIDGQLSEVMPEEQLFATTLLLYRNNKRVQDAMKEWSYHTSRYHSIDQLSFSKATEGISTAIIDRDYLNFPYLEYTR